MCHSNTGSSCLSWVRSSWATMTRRYRPTSPLDTLRLHGSMGRSTHFRAMSASVRWFLDRLSEDATRAILPTPLPTSRRTSFSTCLHGLATAGQLPPGWDGQLLSSLGISDWDVLENEAARSHIHETFAYGFESYLRGGHASTPAMAARVPHPQGHEPARARRRVERDKVARRSVHHRQGHAPDHRVLQGSSTPADRAVDLHSLSLTLGPHNAFQAVEDPWQRYTFRGAVTRRLGMDAGYRAHAPTGEATMSRREAGYLAFTERRCLSGNCPCSERARRGRAILRCGTSHRGAGRLSRDRPRQADSDLSSLETKLEEARLTEQDTADLDQQLVDITRRKEGSGRPEGDSLDTRRQSPTRL